MKRNEAMASHFNRFGGAADNPSYCPSNLAAFGVYPRPFAVDGCARRVLEVRKQRYLVGTDFGIVSRLDARDGMVGFRFVKGVCGRFCQLDEKPMAVAKRPCRWVLRWDKHNRCRNLSCTFPRPRGKKSFAPWATFNSGEF